MYLPCPKTVFLVASLFLLLPSGQSRADDAPSIHLTISPENVLLHGKDARQRLIVTEMVHGRPVDRTRTARFQSETPTVAQVSADGLVTPLADGTATVVATIGAQ